MPSQEAGTPVDQDMKYDGEAAAASVGLDTVEGGMRGKGRVHYAPTEVLQSQVQSRSTSNGGQLESSQRGGTGQRVEVDGVEIDEANTGAVVEDGGGEGVEDWMSYDGDSVASHPSTMAQAIQELTFLLWEFTPTFVQHAEAGKQPGTKDQTAQKKLGRNWIPTHRMVDQVGLIILLVFELSLCGSCSQGTDALPADYRISTPLDRTVCSVEGAGQG